MSDELVTRLAELGVRLGANVQPGQVVRIQAEIGEQEAVRAIAASAYRAGARFVDVSYFDPHVKRARIELAEEATLDFVPPWYGERVLEHARGRGAVISLTGLTSPGVLAGLDSKRAGRDQLPFQKETMMIVNDRSVNWTVIPAPTQAWADAVFPEAAGNGARAQLWSALEHVCRLDEPDPIAAWQARTAHLQEVAGRLTALDLDAVRLEGPGTDLAVGLFPSSRWLAAAQSTVDGIDHLPNVPTEEVFTTPDPARADGTVRSTRPLALLDGTVIRGLEVRFEGGRAVEISAEEGGETLQGRAVIDDGASRLGELALVDRESRIGSLGTVFSNTLLDENAASHIALGAGLGWAIRDEGDRARMNRSAIHIDFMVGGDEIDTVGITAAGDEVLLLRGGAWQV
jgi:aminopeptidase